MKFKFIIVFIIYLFCTEFYFAQNKLIGVITDSETNKKIENAEILLVEKGISTASDIHGEFSFLNLKNASYQLVINHIGFNKKTVDVVVMNNEDLHIKIELTPKLIKIPEVMVSGTRYEESIKDIPAPIEVITQGQILNSSGITLSDITKILPGVAVMKDGMWSTTINIRGLSRQNVVYLVDGSRIETATNISAGLSLIDVYDIKRIEVLKSGSSSLYGTGATGGVVNIITNSRSFSDNFYFNGSLLSGFNSVNKLSAGSLSLYLGNSSWYGKISGTLRSALDAQTPEGVQLNSRFHDNNLSASFGVMPLTDHEIKLDYQRFYASDVGIPGGSAFPENANARYPLEKREMYSAEYKVKNLSSTINSVSLKYFNQLIVRRVELKPSPIAINKPGADHTTNGITFQTDLSISHANKLVAGIDFWSRKYEGIREKINLKENKTVADKPLPDSRYSSIGIFAQDEFFIIPGELKIVAGGRLDKIDISYSRTLSPVYIIANGQRNDNPPGQKVVFEDGSAENFSWSMNAGFLYDLTSDVKISLNAARSFRSPSLEERFEFIDLGGIKFYGDPYLKPEKGLTFDLGIKIWKPELSFSFNAFLNLMDNLVIDQKQSDSLFIKKNVGTARLYGFDSGLEYNFFDNLIFYSVLSYVRGEDTGNNTDLPEIPPLNGTIGIRSPLFNMMNLDISSAFFTAQKNTADDEQSTAGYVLLDAVLTSYPINIAGTNLFITAGIHNILDKAYRNHLTTYRGMIDIEPGRDIYLKARLEW